MSHGPVSRRKSSKNDDHNAERCDNGDEMGLPLPTDGGWGWVVVFSSFMIHIVTDGFTYSFGMFYTEFLDYFEESAAFTSLISAILAGMTLCSGPISSSFVNRYGCRTVTIAGALLAGVCLVISVFAQSVFTLIFTIGIGVGFGFGLIYLPAIVSVTMYFEKYRSIATGIAVCGSGLGTTVFAPLNKILMAEYGWRGAMLIIAALVLNCIIFGALFRPLEHPKKSKRLAGATTAPDTNGTPLVAITTKNNNIRTVHLSNTYLRVPDSEKESMRSKEGDAPLQRSYSIGTDMTKRALKDDNRLQIAMTMAPTAIATAATTTTAIMPTRHDRLRLTLSQPLLNTVVYNDITLTESQKIAGSGTMYRPDILYQGSLVNIPRYRSRAELSTTELNLYGSVKLDTSVANQPNTDTVICGCVPCSKETKDIFTEMMNFSLFKDTVFIIFTISNFLTSIGFYIPYIYLAAHAQQLGMTKTDSSKLLGAIGIANLCGRIVLGYLADKSWVNRLAIYIWSLTICGIATAVSITCLDFSSLFIYSCVFGFTIGAYVGLTSVILVDLLGLEKLTNAFGLLLLFQGIASLIGPPIAGFLFDVLNSYSPGFLFAGITIAISGLMLFMIPPLQRRRAKQDQQFMDDNPTSL